MVLKDFLLSELDQELAATRLLLECVPDAAMPWKPHDRAWSLAVLVAHLSLLPRWGCSILERDRHDLGLGGSSSAAESATRGIAVQRFDRHGAEVRKSLVGLTEGQLVEPWTLTRGAQVMMTLPRVTAFRRFFLYPLVHHRGQLSVYLQLQDVTVPVVYGLSANEPM